MKRHEGIWVGSEPMRAMFDDLVVGFLAVTAILLSIGLFLFYAQSN